MKKNILRKKIVIIGAGYAGTLVAKEIERDALHKYQIVGFIDDAIKIHSQISHYKILGGQRDLNILIKKYSIDEVIIAIPSAKGEQIRSIIEQCKQHKIGFKIVPRIVEILSTNKVSLEQVRSIQPEDLLGREIVTPDIKKISYFLKNKTVLVTGGAGSIGSELCKQIALLPIKNLICFDISESGIYHLEMQLRKYNTKKNIHTIIGNIRNSKKIKQIMKLYQPHIVYHAAAYKHVPLMELNPDEAINNNILGTKILADAALKFKVKNFILISTDKAVNPTNIMGASKRVAEMIMQDYNKRGNTKFISVRFGNVLESSGSVIPLFKSQILSGGPLTITHKNIVRFFMTTSEAVHLVLQSSLYGQGGELFVLDMGEPIKIYDLALSLIRAVGLVPNKDIKIKIVGLRPGEKLYEEKLTDKESMQCVKRQKIYIADGNKEHAAKNLIYHINQLKAVADFQKKKDIVKLLSVLVPTFKHLRDN